VDRSARYIIVGGLVFTPLTFGLMGYTRVGVPRHFASLMHELPTRRWKEAIVVATTLEHPVNAAYRDLTNVVLHRVNGRAVTDLRDVADALRHPVRGYHVLEVYNRGERVETSESPYNWARLVVMPAAEANAAMYELAERHGILVDRSPDLLSA
jgi:hypothetical protein